MFLVSFYVSGGRMRIKAVFIFVMVFTVFHCSVNMTWCDPLEFTGSYKSVTFFLPTPSFPPSLLSRSLSLHLSPFPYVYLSFCSHSVLPFLYLHYMHLYCTHCIKECHNSLSIRGFLSVAQTTIHVRFFLSSLSS